MGLEITAGPRVILPRAAGEDSNLVPSVLAELTLSPNVEH